MSLTEEEFILSTSDAINTDYLHDDIQFLIDEDLRTVTIPSDGVVLGVVGDKNTNRVNFQMVRYYNGIDLSEYLCRVHYINANNEPNYYTVDDVTIENDVLLFTWLVDSPVTTTEGEVSFVVKMTKAEPESEVVTNSFSTTIARAKVLPGIDVLYSIPPEKIKDIIQHILDEINKEISDGIEPTLDNYVRSTGRVITKSNIDEICSGSVDNLSNNKIYSFEILDSDMFPSCGLPCEQGSILTYGSERTNDAVPYGSTQLVLDYDGNMYARLSWGFVWTDWMKFSSGMDVRVEGTELIL